MFIDSKLLEECGACEEQTQLFKKEWPEGVEVTIEVIRRAHELDLDTAWFVERALRPEAYLLWGKGVVEADDSLRASVVTQSKAHDDSVKDALAAYTKSLDDYQRKYPNDGCRDSDEYREVLRRSEDLSLTFEEAQRVYHDSTIEEYEAYDEAVCGVVFAAFVEHDRLTGGKK